MGVKLGVKLIEKHKLGIFMRVLERRVFRPRGDVIEWSLENHPSEKLHNLYCTLSGMTSLVV
jgi:hypothetical protein